MLQNKNAQTGRVVPPPLNHHNFFNDLLSYSLFSEHNAASVVFITPERRMLLVTGTM